MLIVLISGIFAGLVAGAILTSSALHNAKLKVGRCPFCGQEIPPQPPIDKKV